jgi:branched-chain amino acid transport system substrate-binding protein
MRRFGFGAGLISLLAAALLISGCGGSSGGSSSGGSSSASGGETVTIGMLAQLTGPNATDGKLSVKGAKLAIKEINEAGGVNGDKLELKVSEVGEGQPDVVARQVQELLADSSVKAVISGLASSTNFEIEPLGRAEMPYLIGANSAQTAEIIEKDPSSYGTVWSIGPSYDAYNTDLPKRITGWEEEGMIKLPSRSAFVVTSDNPYSEGISKGLVETMEKEGWDIKGEETVPLTEIDDWSTVLAKVRAAEPGLVINTDYQPANDATFMEQFVENPTNSLVFIQYGPSVPEFVSLTKGASNGVLYNNLLGPIDSPKWKPGVEMIEKFEAAYGEEPGVMGAGEYDSVQVYAEALRKVGDPNEKAAIGKALGETNMDVSQGHLEFEPETHLAKEGDTLTPLQYFQIRNGKRELLAPPQYANAKLQPPPWMEGQ